MSVEVTQESASDPDLAGRAAVVVATGRRRIAGLMPRSADLAAMGQHPRSDVIAGITVALVALPLALAFGIASGLGAEAGLATAVVAGVLAAVFGGSNVQVSGPTGAMTVVLVPIFAAFGSPGVLAVGLLAGVILVGLAIVGAGRTIRYIPLPVIEGFTVGIAAIIAIQQIPAALGVVGGGEAVIADAVAAVERWSAAPVWGPPAIAVGVAGSMLIASRVRPGLPVSLAAVVIAALIVAMTPLDMPVVGTLPSTIPGPALPAVGVAGIGALVVPAVAVAALASMESLLSATVADGMRVDERHDPDRELFGQGIANLVTPFFGGIPATAAIARTAVNVRSGARSRLAAVVQSLSLLVVVLTVGELVGAIPLAALAGVLIATAIQMVEVSSLSALMKSTRGDAAALLVTAGATLALDLVTAVILGLVVAGAFALQQLARTASIDVTPVDHADHSDEEQALFREHIVVYRLEGPLFFGAAHDFLLELAEVSEVRVVVLRMSRIVTLDATGAAVLADTIRRLESRRISVMLSGIRPGHVRILAQLGVFTTLATERHVFERTPDAIAHARVHAARLAHVPVLAGSAAVPGGGG